MTYYDIISYILIGVFFTAAIVSLIALLRKTIKEQRELERSKATKKDQPHQLKTESYVFSSAKS